MEDTQALPARPRSKAQHARPVEPPQAAQPAGDNHETLTVLVLMGGPSAERQVSLASGQAVCAALQTAGHQVLHGDILPDQLAVLEENPFDIVFPVLHGTFGEDGQLQTILQDRGLAFCGSDAAASALAMDKHRSKEVLADAGLLCPLGELITTDNASGGRAFELALERAIERVGLPCVIKPNAQGSSVGITMATHADEATLAVKAVLRDYGDCLIERFVGGRELTVGIIGQEVLPVLQVKPAQGFYDYHAKYEDNHTQYLFETDLAPSLLVAVQECAYRAFEALGCRDFARVDLILDALDRPFILEVNTIPGCTDHSLLPKAAARAGITMPEMCRRIVQMASQRRSQTAARV